MLPPQQEEDEANSSSPARRTSSSASASALPAHLRIQEMALSPSSPLHSGAAILIRHHSSSDSPLRPKLRDDDEGGGGLEEGSYASAVATMMKVCMGTGMLALPYAVARGGLVVSAVGLLLMGAWNAVAVQQLLACRAAVEAEADAEAVDANGLYAFIARQACGRSGEVVVKLSLGITLFGAAVSYLVAAADAVGPSFGGNPTVTRLISSFISVGVVLPLSLQHFSFLAHTSVAGLLALGLAFLVLILNGITQLSTNPPEPEPGHPSLFSTTPQGLAEFFGVASFGFGIPPLAFPIQRAMHRPEHFSWAVRWSMAMVALLYIGICETVAVLYPHAPSNILLALPPDSILSTGVRLLVAAVCLLSYPLALVPLAESMEQALLRARAQAPDEERAPLRAGASAPPPSNEGFTRSRLVVRVGVVLASAVFATAVPCFGVVVAFMGAFSVALLGLVLPPLFHLCLVSRRQTRADAAKDVVLLALGTVATLVATALTAKAGFLSILETHRCPK